MKKWLEKEILFIKENYKTKINKEICKVLNRSSSAVRFVAGKLKLKKNPDVVCKAHKHNQIDITKSILEKMYIHDRKSVRVIAKELGLGKNTIGYYLIKYKIPTRTVSEANKSFYANGGKIWRTGLTKETDQRIVLATSKMRETRRRLKIERLKQKEKEIGETLKDAISRLYHKEGFTQEIVAKKLGLSREFIIKLMNQYNISKRPNYQQISSLKGKNHSMYGRKWEDTYGVEGAKKLKAKRSAWSRENIIKRLKNREMPFKETKIEKAIARELSKRNINFISQYPIGKSFVCDFALPEYKIIIECDGDYWHANPKLYNKLNKIQERKVKTDKFKDKYLEKEGWKVLRFFESDINGSVSNCVDTIENQIKKVANPFDNLGMQNQII